jgi:hypothetical protein
MQVTVIYHITLHTITLAILCAALFWWKHWANACNNSSRQQILCFDPRTRVLRPLANEYSKSDRTTVARSTAIADLSTYRSTHIPLVAIPLRGYAVHPSSRVDNDATQTSIFECDFEAQVTTLSSYRPTISVLRPKRIDFLAQCPLVVELRISFF